MQWNKSLDAMVLIAILMAGVLSFSIGFSLIISSIRVANTGVISVEYALSGSPADIQAAVNRVEAAGGGTVHIPAGNWTWNGGTVTIPAGVNVMGSGLAGCADHTNNWTSYTATTILHENLPNANMYMPNMFVVQGSDTVSSKPSRISGIQFEATAPINYAMESSQEGCAIYIHQAYNFRVDHCTFVNFCNIAVFADANSGSNHSASAYGVIDHCVCTNPYKLNTEPTGSEWLWAYGFYARGAGNYNWDSNITHFLGKYGAIAGCSLMYVEDCHFSYCRHATDGLQCNWNVVRYNLIDHEYPAYGCIDLHGSASWYSGRGMEVYNNTVVGVSSSGWGGNNAGVRLRGGAGFIFNNTYTQSPTDTNSYGVQLDNSDDETTYPFTAINNTYVWGNACIGATAFIARQGIQNVNYFLRAPSQAQDGFTYTPYSYPISNA